MGDTDQNAQRPRSITTITYDASDRLVTVGGDPARTQTYTYKVPPPRPRPLVVEARDAFGRAVRWELATDTPDDDPATLERAFIALINAIDLLPLLSARWRLRSVEDRDGRRTAYAFDEGAGTVTVTAAAGGETEELRLAAGERLVRLTDAETGAVSHVVEPATVEVVYEFDPARAASRPSARRSAPPALTAGGGCPAGRRRAVGDLAVRDRRPAAARVVAQGGGHLQSRGGDGPLG